MRPGLRLEPIRREDLPDVFQEIHAQWERASTRPKPRTQAQNQEWRQRANTKRRLTTLGDSIDALAARIELIHTEGVTPWGMGEPGLPLFPELWDGRKAKDGIAARFLRVQHEAEQGCALSADFLRVYAPVYALCAELRREPPFVRTPEQERARNLARLSPAATRQLEQITAHGWGSLTDSDADDESPAEQNNFDA